MSYVSFYKMEYSYSAIVWNKNTVIDDLEINVPMCIFIDIDCVDSQL